MTFLSFLIRNWEKKTPNISLFAIERSIMLTN